MLKIKDMNLNNVIRQGDTQPREYQLDTGNLDLNLTNKSATIRLMTADFQGIGYETTATVSSENKISFSIDDVIPARQYRLEVTVDDYVFPSRATDGQFNIDPSSHGQEVNIINVIGKEEIVRDVKARVENELEPLVTSLESAQQSELDRQAQEEARETAESQREANELVRTEGMVKLENLNRAGKQIELEDYSVSHRHWHPDSDFNLKSGHHYYTYRELSPIYIGTGAYGRLDNLQGIRLIDNNHSLSNITIPTSDYSGVFTIYGQIDESKSKWLDLTIIDLTEAFGAGNEPDKEEMDELIKLTDYIDGEITLSQKQLLNWQLKLIRQNRNAIITLGGTF